MKNTVVLVVVSFIFLGLVTFFIANRANKETNSSSSNEPIDSTNSGRTGERIQNDDLPQVSVFATGLDVPWAIAFLPSGELLVTERAGTVRLVTKDGQVQQSPVAVLSNVKEFSEGGLHGIALHPDFATNQFVYLFYTYSGSGNDTLNRVVRMKFVDSQLTDETTIVDAIPGASNHDGGRVKFGPDGYLYITTGDAQEPSLAQDTNSLAGKILRVKDDGSAAPNNPFGNRVYSYGHRNPQGIAWDDQGRLWSTEHGPSGLETGNDEVNVIEMGVNYGWPEIRGTQTRSGMRNPIIESGRGTAWAPAGVAFANGNLYFGGLRGTAVYELNTSGTPQLTTYFKNEYGRIREVIAGPDGMLYISTSNRDGRGSPKSGDDKIMRVNPSKL